MLCSPSRNQFVKLRTRSSGYSEFVRPFYCPLYVHLLGMVVVAACHVGIFSLFTCVRLVYVQPCPLFTSSSDVSVVLLSAALKYQWIVSVETHSGGMVNFCSIPNGQQISRKFMSPQFLMCSINVYIWISGSCVCTPRHAAHPRCPCRPARRCPARILGLPARPLQPHDPARWFCLTTDPVWCSAR